MYFQNLFKKIKDFFVYWYEKREEVRFLKLRDLKQLNIISQIELFTVKKEKIFIGLKSIRLLHPIDRESALEKIKQREKRIKDYTDIDITSISQKELDEIMPSITPIKVVRWKKRYIVWEGNGRIVALKKVFLKNVEVEVVEYHLDEVGKKIVNHLLEELYKE